MSDPAHGPLVIYVTGSAYFNSSSYNFGVAYCSIQQLRTVGMISCRGTKDKQSHHPALQDVHMRRNNYNSSTLSIYVDTCSSGSRSVFVYQPTGHHRTDPSGERVVASHGQGQTGSSDWFGDACMIFVMVEEFL